MKDFLLSKVWPVVAGFLTASVIMMIFEFANSFIYPLPAGLDWTDAVAVKAVTAALPWTAYILVLLGWIAGSFKAGCVTTYLAREEKYRLTFVVGILLTLAGIGNNLMLGTPMLFSLISIPSFIIFTYLGHVYLRKVYRARGVNFN